MRWLLLAGLLVPTGTQAVQASALGVYPSGSLASPTPWFQYNLQPGQVTANSITVDNRTSSSQDLQLYAVDAAPNGDGGFGMQSQVARARDAGAWVRLDASNIHLAPNAKQSVGFLVTVPRHVSVGPHYAGIIAQPLVPTISSNPGLQVHVVSRLGVRMYFTIPGKQQPHLVIASMYAKTQGGNIVLLATLANTGNTLLSPKGTLRLSSLWLPAKRLAFNAGSIIVPGQTLVVQMPTEIAANSFPHHYTATLHLDYGTGTNRHSASNATAFWTGSLVWVVYFGGALLVAAGLTVKYGRHRRRNRHNRDQGKA